MNLLLFFRNNILYNIIMNILDEISINLQTGKRKLIRILCEQALEDGVDPCDILNKGLLRGMYELGDRFRKNEVFVPHVLLASQAMKTGMDVLKPYLQNGGAVLNETVCIGTVLGDVHDIGKNMVIMTLEGEGFKVIDLGVDVPADLFVETARQHGSKIIVLSALLTTTKNHMREVVEAFEKAGIRDQVFIMVGGAPVTEDYARIIGADAYTDDCFEAAKTAKEYIFARKKHSVTKEK